LVIVSAFAFDEVVVIVAAAGASFWQSHSITLLLACTNRRSIVSSAKATHGPLDNHVILNL
jgi:hypothetical protein